MYIFIIPFVIFCVGMVFIVGPDIITEILAIAIKFGDATVFTTFSLFLLLGLALLMANSPRRKRAVIGEKKKGLLGIIEKLSLIEFVLVLANERLMRENEKWLLYSANHENALMSLKVIGSILVIFSLGAVTFTYLLVKKLTNGNGRAKAKAPTLKRARNGRTKVVNATRVIPIEASACTSVELQQQEYMMRR